MKNLKKIILLVIAVAILGSATVAFAASPTNNASGLTGKTTDEFKAQMLKQKKAILDERVKAGSLTQQQADEIYSAIKENQANCDGSGNAGIGKKYGVGFGKGNGSCNGAGFCRQQ